jgi:hypothetical protein
MTDEEREELYNNMNEEIEEWKHVLNLLEAERDGLIVVNNK